MLRRVAVRVRAADAEIARARLLELAPEGFEEVGSGEAVELALYLDAGAEEMVRAAFADAEVASTPVEAGWDVRWRSFHRSTSAGGLWIGPPWERPPRGEIAVVVDPGRAFGTGAHPTTRASIELLAGRPRGSVLDAGCGSGVIAVAAARLGFAPVHAVDVDPVAVETALRTASDNGVGVDARVADVLVDDLPHVDLLVANIELRIVEALLARATAATAITSGYLAAEAPAVRGWEREDRYELDGWAADVWTATALS